MGASTPEQVENLIRMGFHEAAGWDAGSGGKRRKTG